MSARQTAMENRSLGYSRGNRSPVICDWYEAFVIRRLKSKISQLHHADLRRSVAFMTAWSPQILKPGCVAPDLQFRPSPVRLRAAPFLKRNGSPMGCMPRHGVARVRGKPGYRSVDVGRPDHFAPFLSFVGDEFPEFGRRHWRRHIRKVGEPRVRASAVVLALELERVRIGPPARVSAPTPPSIKS